MSHDHILKRLSEEEERQAYLRRSFDLSQMESLWGIDPYAYGRYLQRFCEAWHWLNDCPDCRYDLEESAMMNFDYDTYDPQHPDKNAWLVDYFYKATRVAVPSGYLTAYNGDQLKHMRLFKVKGIDAGFAIKNANDAHGNPTEDLVAVHNNSPQKKLAAKMTMDAIRADAKTLDHFDGKLGTIYEPMGFKEYHAAEWDDEYKPAGWNVTDIPIESSRHGSKINTYTPEEAKKIIDRYKDGKPDIVYRRIGK